MVEQFGELDEGHFAVGTGHFDDPAAEGLAKGVGGKVLDLDVINGLDPFQVAVHHLAGQDRLVFAEEARLRLIWTTKRPPAVHDVPLETLVNFDFPALARLFLNEGKGSDVREYLLPAERP